MIGIFLMSLSTLFGEFSTVVGKKKIENREQGIYTMGFLNLFWIVIGFSVIALFVPGSFVFSTASLATFIPRLALEILQAHMTVKAVVYSARGTFGFIRALTIPLLLVVDLMLGYRVGMFQFIGMSIIAFLLVVLFIDGRIERKGAAFVLFTALNGVITISLYKYNISHFNTVIGEQLIIFSVVLTYFFIMAFRFSHENPLRFLKKKIFFAQSASMGIGSALESFAYAFAPASVILATKRSSSILWSIISGNLYFGERHLTIKLMAFIVLVAGLILLVL